MLERLQGHLASLKAGGERAWAAAGELWQQLARAVPPLGRVGRFVAEVLGKYYKDDCLSYAAGLSFWLIVSLVPLSRCSSSCSAPSSAAGPTTPAR